MNKRTALRGTAIAAAVAAAFIAGGAVAADSSGTAAPQVKCIGGNSCKGQSLCQTASTGCKGSNSCKGKGWIYTADAESCIKAGGKPESPPKAD